MRLFIAVADQGLRVAMQLYLHQETGMEIIGCAANSKGLLAQVEASEPDVLLLDWQLTGKPVTALIKEIRALELSLHIIVLSVRPEEEMTFIDSGADAYIGKSNLPEELISCLRTLQDKKQYEFKEDKSNNLWR